MNGKWWITAATAAGAYTIALLIWGAQIDNRVGELERKNMAEIVDRAADRAAGHERQQRIVRLETQADSLREAISELRASLAGISVKLDRLIELRTQDILKQQTQEPAIRR
jgi:hypothetical protein